MPYTIAKLHVVPRLPAPIADLEMVAQNLWWSWNPNAVDLFRRMDPVLWQSTNHNPVLLLGTIDQGRLERLSGDEAFRSHLKRVVEQLRAQTSARCWMQKRANGTEIAPVAFFSAEFGITECLAIYSGGLGILSGDFLGAASELGYPMVGVGLMYREGYFQQWLTPDGWQQERYPANDLATLPVRPMRGPDGQNVTVVVEAPHPVYVQAYVAQVGRVPLYLLTTDIEPNRQEDRDITARLYGGNLEMRLRQEIVLGIGGLRMLTALGVEPGICHLNEGHAAFCIIERIRQIRETTGCEAAVAHELAAAGTHFTTHTPVPAGHDEFDADMMHRYFSWAYEGVGLDRTGFMALGQKKPGSSERFSVTVLALHLSGAANGVAKLHGETARVMYQEMWPNALVDEIPVGSITNGIHTRTWLSREMSELFDHYLGPRWQANPEDSNVWKAIDDVPDDELWRVHERRRERLVIYTREKVLGQVQARHGAAREAERVREVLDPRILTIGFARRFATYKRAGLILRDPARLERLLTDPHRPIQLVFAGKAHPHDELGKRLIQLVFSLCRNEKISRRVAFVQNYSIEVARHLVQGVDVWLNTPRRPQEASGTSGMKVAANGGLNLSILDGWWPEAFDGENGWAIGDDVVRDDTELQDELEARSLYALLEDEIIPLFYQRGRDGVPHDWVRRMKASLKTIGPQFNTVRMCLDYSRKYYVPLQDRYVALAADGASGAVDLVKYRRRIDQVWRDVKILVARLDRSVDVPVGESVGIQARVQLAGLTPSDVRVEALFGTVSGGALSAPASVALEPVGVEGNLVLYSGQVPCRKTGMAGVAVRILPQHALMRDQERLGRITWL